MPATQTTTKTGNPDIDGLLSSSKCAVNSLTHSFPTSSADFPSMRAARL